MPTPDDLTPDAFARLSALEQSQELLRRAQFLDTSSRARHADALDHHQIQLDWHEGMHREHLLRMGRLDDMLLRQQELQAQVNALQARMDARGDDHAQRLAHNDAVLARLQLILDAVLDILRHRNGHGGQTA